MTRTVVSGVFVVEDFIRLPGDADLSAHAADILVTTMRYILRFLWNATRGHHLTPWRSAYLRWRIETYTGIKMHSIGFLEFWGFSWRERRELLRFLKWTAEMEHYARVKPKNP